MASPRTPEPNTAARLALVEAYPYPVMFYDGVCNMCNGAVQFVLRHDRSGRIHFLALQSQRAQELLVHYGRDPRQMNSMLLLRAGRLYEQTDAVLHTARAMGGAWRLLGQLGLLVPRGLRDALYRILAQNRYRWFGRTESCALPTPALRMRTLA